MWSIRKPVRAVKSKPVMEGAGVRLKRAIGFGDEYLCDPFLLLDDIHSKNPADYLAGFPWHPHRGIETVTYVLRGEVVHGDSIGNSGAIGSGDVQWMTAGSGIIHQEMPRATPGDFRGLQLWVNLPASHKMMEPRYRGIVAAELPMVDLGGGASAKVIAGTLKGVDGPAKDLVRSPDYFDLTLPPGFVFEHLFPENYKVICYVLEGAGDFGDGESHGAETLALFGEGERVVFTAGDEDMRLLLFAGEPLEEPIAWRGPIVMNTWEELEEAFEELDRGTFIK